MDGWIDGYPLDYYDDWSPCGANKDCIVFKNTKSTLKWNLIQGASVIALTRRPYLAKSHLPRVILTCHLLYNYTTFTFIDMTISQQALQYKWIKQKKRNASGISPPAAHWEHQYRHDVRSEWPGVLMGKIRPPSCPPPHQYIKQYKIQIQIQNTNTNANTNTVIT